MEEAIRYAKKYLEDLLSFFGLNTDVYATSEDDVIELEVPSTHLNGFLIGQKGENMRSMQFLVSNALKFTGTKGTIEVIASQPRYHGLTSGGRVTRHAQACGSAASGAPASQKPPGPGVS